MPISDIAGIAASSASWSGDRRALARLEDLERPVAPLPFGARAESLPGRVDLRPVGAGDQVKRAHLVGHQLGAVQSSQKVLPAASRRSRDAAGPTSRTIGAVESVRTPARWRGERRRGCRGRVAVGVVGADRDHRRGAAEVRSSERLRPASSLPWWATLRTSTGPGSIGTSPASASAVSSIEKRCQRASRTSASSFGSVPDGGLRRDSSGGGQSTSRRRPPERIVVRGRDGQPGGRAGGADLGEHAAIEDAVDEPGDREPPERFRRCPPAWSDWSWVTIAAPSRRPRRPRSFRQASSSPGGPPSTRTAGARPLAGGGSRRPGRRRGRRRAGRRDGERVGGGGGVMEGEGAGRAPRGRGSDEDAGSRSSGARSAGRTANAAGARAAAARLGPRRGGGRGRG